MAPPKNQNFASSDEDWVDDAEEVEEVEEAEIDEAEFVPEAVEEEAEAALDRGAGMLGDMHCGPQ